MKGAALIAAPAVVLKPTRLLGNALLVQPPTPVAFLRPANRTVLTLGDSRTFQATGNTPGSEFSFLAQGVIGWLKFLTRQRFNYEPSNNYGVSGDTTAMMLARVPAMLAGDPGGTVMVLGGTNDRTTGPLTYAQTISNLSAIRDLCLAAGRLVIFVDELPRGDASNTGNRLTATQLAIHFRVREWILSQRTVPNVFVFDAWGGTADPTSTTGDDLTALFKDGLHENPAGALQIALNGQGLFTALFPPVDLMPQSNSDLYDATNNIAGSLQANPMMLGSGGTFNATGGSGTVATSYSENNGTTLTRTYSKTANDRQQVVLGGTGTAGSIDFRQVISAGQLNVGDQVYSAMDVSIAASVANMSQLSLRLLDNNAIVAGDFRRALSTELFPNVAQALSGVMKTPIYTLTTTTLQTQFEYIGINTLVPAATITINSWVTRKAGAV